jgi:uncharacterized metal-binding protein YceD (DUF177 family)
MLLDLSRIRTGTEHVERRYEPPALHRDDDAFRLASPVDLVADAHKDKQKIRLTGRVRATLELDCSRCLESFQIPVDAPFDMLLPGRDDRPRRGDSRAVLPGAADEAAVPRRLPGVVSGVRREPKS